MILTERDIANHALKALRLSREPEALTALKAEILVAAQQFLEALDLEIAERAIERSAFLDSPQRDYEQTRQKAAQALLQLAGKPLDWFADLHDWRSADENPAYAAGHIIRRVIRKIFRDGSLRIEMPEEPHSPSPGPTFTDGSEIDF